MRLNPYLTFQGQCREALIFYKHCFGGEVGLVETFSKAPFDVPQAWENKILHAEFKAGNMSFMACDTMPNTPVAPSNQVALSLNFTDLSEQSRVFAALTQGGEVTMPLEKTFWHAHFGTLTDKFGIRWMLNCNDSVSN